MSNQNATSMRVTDREAWAAAAHWAATCGRPMDEFSVQQQTALLTMRAAADAFLKTLSTGGE